MNSMFITYLAREPHLLFSGSHQAPDPKVGISLFGPYSKQPLIKIGIIGDKKTIEQTKFLLDKYKNPIEAPPTDYPNWTRDFPGFSQHTPFNCELSFSDSWIQVIQDNEILEVSKLENKERISAAVDLYVNKLKNLKDLENCPDVIICSPPFGLIQLCKDVILRNELQAEEKVKTRTSRLSVAYQPGQSRMFDFFDEEERASYEDPILRELGENFHNYLKARSMDIGIPTQMILPSTLDFYCNANTEIRKQDEATFAWNLFVALYYKSGGQPWVLANIPKGTCFVGISFYKEKKIFGGKMATSMAQVFTPEGEGLILKGERFEWASKKSPHLSRESAKRLMEKVVNLYQNHYTDKPSRVVVHKSSRFWPEEKEGFEDVLVAIPRHDLVTISPSARNIKFYRAGYNPVIRGTIVKLPDESYLLYTKAYIPYLGLYPGPRVPKPLEILEHHGSSTMEQICNEIISLTKLNWNSADFTSLFPITLQFSRTVGRVMRELPPRVVPQTKYKFYM